MLLLERSSEAKEIVGGAVDAEVAILPEGGPISLGEHVLEDVGADGGEDVLVLFVDEGHGNPALGIFDLGGPEDVDHGIRRSPGVVHSGSLTDAVLAVAEDVTRMKIDELEVGFQSKTWLVLPGFQGLGQRRSQSFKGLQRIRPPGMRQDE